jgi:hypothetical protein
VFEGDRVQAFELHHDSKAIGILVASESVRGSTALGVLGIAVELFAHANN